VISSRELSVTRHTMLRKAGTAFAFLIALLVVPRTQQRAVARVGKSQEPSNWTSSQLQFPPETLADLGGAAQRLSDAIERNHLRSVLVLGVGGPQDQFSILGLALGDQLSSELHDSQQKFHVIARQQLQSFLTEQRLNAFTATNANLAHWLCNHFNADALALASFEKLECNRAIINLYLFRAAPFEAKSIAGWKFDLHLNESLRDAPSSDPQPAQPKLSVKPSCGSCPRPNYTPEARSAHYEGDVRAEAVVTKAGIVTDIYFFDAIPYGLTENTLDDLKGWKLKPGRDSAGNTVDARIQVIVSYRLR
jgi:hypothetical protein